MTEGLPPRKRTPRPIRLQPRDLEMLRSLAVARYLTVPAIEWLHYTDWTGTRNGQTVTGGWRARYRAFLAQRQTDPSAAYYPAPKLYRRLAACRAGPAPLVHRITRTAERARTVYTRLPDAYALAEAGAALLCAQCGDDRADLWYEDPRPRAIKNFEHAVAIGTFYAALRAALEFAGQPLTDWRGEHVLAGRDPQGGPAYDRVRVPGVRDPLAVLPDGTCTIGGQRYFVEIDRGTTNLRAWGEKVRAYEGYRHSPPLAARYGTETFTVLVVAPTEVRLRRIAEAVLKVTRQATTTYRFLLAERVHPTTIRAGWQGIEAVQWQRRMVVDRLVEVPTAVAWSPVSLWTVQR